MKLMRKNSSRVSQHINAHRAKVYRALIDANAIAKWKVPTGMTFLVHEFDARESGSIRISTAHTDTYHGHFAFREARAE